MMKLLIPVIFLLAISAVFAIPGVPHNVYGSVTINGAAAPDGTVISARIVGVEIATTTTSGGKYGQMPAPTFNIQDTDPPSREGSTVNFFVNGVDTGTILIFHNGGSNGVGLAASISPPPGGGGGGGGGGSGGGGGGGAPITGQTTGSTNTTTNTEPPVNTQENEECTERWLCTDWSWCADGYQTRSCEDVNRCGTETYKAQEKQPCVVQEGSLESNPIIGLAIANPTLTAGAGIIVIIAIAAAYLLWKKSKKKAAKK